MVLTIGALRIRIEWSQMPPAAARARAAFLRQRLERELEAERHQLRLRCNTSLVRF